MVAGHNWVSKRSANALFFVYLLVLIKIILFKNPAGLANTIDFYNFFGITHNVVPPILVPFKTIKSLLHQGFTWYVLQNIAGNIIAFTPLGILIPFLYPSLSSSKIVFASFTLSLMFELIQLNAGIGIFDVDDLTLNTLGAILGLAIYRILSRKRNILSSVNHHPAFT